MKRRRSKRKPRFLFVTVLILCIILITIKSCFKPRKDSNTKEASNVPKIEQLESRIIKLEKQLDTKKLSNSLNSSNYIKGPIKSITLRLESADDRLRIYWEDGGKSDLPCTKEQATWICG